MAGTRASFLDHVTPEAVILFVGAHPDDETTVSPLLAWCAERCYEVVVVSLTRGQSGWNLGPEDLSRTLAQVRDAELTAATEILGCTPVSFDYVNGVSKAHPGNLAVHDPADQAVARWQACGAKHISPETHYQRWTGEAGDPAETLLNLYRGKHPTVILALEPANGFTGHPEHITATMAARKALHRYNTETGRDIPLFYVHPNDAAVEGATTITAEQLRELGGRDYRGIAWRSWNCYESQYGPNDGGEKLSRFMEGCIDAYQLSKAP